MRYNLKCVSCKHTWSYIYIFVTVMSHNYIILYALSGDLAYFDGLTEVILTAGLVLPKPGIFQEHIQFLLVLATPVDIVILGISFTGDDLLCTCVHA